MLFKIIVILMLILIFVSLGTALYYLVNAKNHSTELVKALTVRISLSLILFILLLVAYGLGWITPHGV